LLPEGVEWWAGVQKVAVRREEYLRWTPTQVRLLTQALRIPMTGERGLARRSRSSRSTVQRILHRAKIVRGRKVQVRLKDGSWRWATRLSCPLFRVALLLGQVGSTKGPSLDSNSPSSCYLPEQRPADRANPPPQGASSPVASPPRLPSTTVRWYRKSPPRRNSGLETLGSSFCWS
jgi:hypothetical protein